MISGITTALDIDFHGFPFDLAIKTWTRVCDEIIVVTHLKESYIVPLCLWAKGFGLNQYGTEKVKIRSILEPRNFEVFRFLGNFYCSKPDFIVHFDLDYLISPTDAAALREVILKAPPETEIITYKLVYLNYYATHTTWIPEQHYVPPYDGTHGEYPLIVNPRQNMFISPFTGVAEHENLQVNFESVVSLKPDKYGMTYNTKFRYHNPDNFNIIQSNVIVEHLFWFLHAAALKKKLTHPYWVKQGYDIDWAKKGFQPYEKSYSELDEARKRLEILSPDI